MKKVSYFLLLSLFIAIGIFLDLVPIRVPDGVDKVCHFLGFVVITFVAISTFVSFYGKKSLDYFLMFLLTFGSLFAGLSEFVQKFVSIRECDAGDWLTNLLGITLVVAITYLVNSKERRTAELNEGYFDFKDLPASS